MRISQLPRPIQNRIFDITGPISSMTDLNDAFSWGRTTEGSAVWGEVNRGNYDSFYRIHPHLLPTDPDDGSPSKELAFSIQGGYFILHSYISPDRTAKMNVTKDEAKLLVAALQKFIDAK